MSLVYEPCLDLDLDLDLDFENGTLSLYTVLSRLCILCTA